MLSEEQMNEHRKFYDYAYELFNSNSQINSLTTFTNSSNQYAFYKNYFQDKSQTSSGTFFKNKRTVLKEKNSTSKISTITTEKMMRDDIVGGSQGRRVSSAKPKVNRK